MSEDLSAAVLRHLRARRLLGGEGCWTIDDICRGFDLASDAVEAAVLKLEAGGSVECRPHPRAERPTRMVLLAPSTRKAGMA